MNRNVRTWRRLAARVLWGLGTSLLLPVSADAAPELWRTAAPQANAPKEANTQKGAPQAKSQKTAPAECRVLSLADCVQIALERQPALAAYRASLAAAEAQEQALWDLKLAAAISHDIPIRRKQAALGVVIATAGLKQAEWDTVYAVTRTYFTVLYAQAQQRVAKDAVEGLESYSKLLTDLQAPEAARLRTRAYASRAKLRRTEAERGVDRAVAALREAMGVDCDFPCFVPKGTLPVPEIQIDCCGLVALALERRGELIQAANAAEVTSLEVEAQGATCLPLSRTFASVVDIHVRPIPQGTHDHDYRPGAIALEMPPNLVGKKHDRVERAEHFHARALAVVDKTRGLIVLEAKDAYYRWQQAAEQITEARRAEKSARDLKAETRKPVLEPGGKPTDVERKDHLEAIVLVAQAKAGINQAVYEHLLALADLQRITAGGILLGWDGCAKEHP
jgi:outer membrane protein TolC